MPRMTFNLLSGLYAFVRLASGFRGFNSLQSQESQLGFLSVERIVVTGYYLAPKFILWRGLLLASCMLGLWAKAAAQTQSSTTASVRGEAYEQCKSFFSGSATDLPDSEENNAFLNSCGWRFYDYHEETDAGRAFTQAIGMAERRHDHPKLADALDGSGNVQRRALDFSDAEQLLQRALRLAEEIQDKEELAKVYISFGRLHADQGIPDENCSGGLRIVKLMQELHNPLQTAIANNNLGTCYNARGDYGAALPYFQQSLTALRQINEELKSATPLDNIGQCYWSLGDLSKAIETFRQSLTIREKYKDDVLIGKSLDSLGSVYLEQGNYAAALESLQNGFDLRTKSGALYDAAESLNNIATVYEAQGEYAQAALYLHRALKTAEKMGNRVLVAQLDTQLGEVYSLEGHYAQAFAALQLALQNSRAADDKVRLAAARYALGRVYLITGRLSAAREVLEQARDFYESTGTLTDLGNALVELAEVERREGQLTEGLDLAAHARDLGERVGSPELQWRSVAELGRLNAATGHREEAAKSFEDAIAVIEEERAQVAGREENRARFFSKRVAPYQERIALAISSGKVEDALYYAERSKARVLLDVIGADRVPLTTAMNEEERDGETKLRTTLASLNSQILVAGQGSSPDEKQLAALKQQRDEARLEFEQFESTVYSSHPELAVSRGTVPTFRAREAKTLLPVRSAAIIEYAALQDRTWLFLVTGSGVRVYRLALNNSQLIQQVEHFRQQLARRDLNITESTRQLYRQVLGPVDALLKDKTELVIIPDGILWDLPFQALQSRPDHYLIEDCTISYAPSLTTLREMMGSRRQPIQRQTLLAFANPTIGASVAGRRKITLMDEHLAPLPDAEIQAKSVAEVYRPDSQVFLGAEAREDRWKAEAPRYRILHLATHGVLDDRSPLYSYLVLSPSNNPTNPEDGLLEAWEIMRTRLHADLVVLSACETARGRISAGEAVIGLTWAFFVAGTPTTVVSQWKVESASSSALMADFHQRWKGGSSGLPKARALQMAAVKMLQSSNYSHPFYWAGYILVGDGR